MPFADDHPYESGNLVQLSFIEAAIDANAVDFRLSKVQRRKLTVTAKGADDLETVQDLPLHYDIDCDVLFKTSKSAALVAESREAVGLEFDLGDDLAAPVELIRIKGRLFGIDVALTTKSIHSTATGLRADFDFTPGITRTSSGITLREATLTIVHGARMSATFEIEGDVSLFDTEDPHKPGRGSKVRIFHAGENEEYRWLGLNLESSVAGKAERGLIIDHERGIFLLRFEGRNGRPLQLEKEDRGDSVPRSELFRGFKFEDAHAWMAATCSVTRSNQLGEDGFLSFDNVSFNARVADLAPTRSGFAARCRISPLKRQARLVFDALQPQPIESGVRWPLDSVTASGSGPGSSLLVVPGAAALEHHIVPRLISHEIDLAFFGGDPGRPHLERPLQIHAVVDHLLKTGDDVVLSWSGIDTITLYDAQSLARLAASDLDWFKLRGTDDHEYALTSFHRGDVYRKPDGSGGANGRLELSYMRHSGMARPVHASSGFLDEVLLKAVKDAGANANGRGLIAFGSAMTLLETDKSALCFTLPWVVRLAGEGHEGGGGSVLWSLQRFTKKRSWRAANYDGRPLLLDFRADEIDRRTLPRELAADRILDIFGDASGTRYEKGAVKFEVERRVWRELELVEQALFEAVPTSAASSGVQSIQNAEWPFFLRSIVALNEVMKTLAPKKIDASGRFSTLFLRPGRNRTTRRAFRLAFGGEAYEPSDQTASTRPPMDLTHPFFTSIAGARLLTVDAAGGAALEDLENIAGISLDDLQIGGKNRLREIAESQVRKPHAIIGQRYDAQQFALSSVDVEPRDRSDELGAVKEHSSRLRRFDQAVYPSPALGWPSVDTLEPTSKTSADVKTEIWAAKNAIIGGEDSPVVSNDVGLAGRSAGFGMTPKAKAQEETTRPSYLASMSRVIFQRVADTGHDGDLELSFGPPARHLMLLPPRMRSPVEGAVVRALDDVETGASDRAAPIMPPQVIRTYVGQRAGVIEATIDAVVQGTGKGGFDREFDDFGAPATLSPGLLRQVRSPRSPELPDDQDLALRRRTFVSKVDRQTESKGEEISASALKEFLLIDGDAILIRREFDGGLERRFLLELIDVEKSGFGRYGSLLGPTFRKALSIPLRIRFKQTARLDSGEEVIAASNAADMMSALADVGILGKRDPNNDTLASLVAEIRLGELSVALKRIKWKKPEVDEKLQEVTLETTLFLNDGDLGQDVEPLVAATQEANPDVDVDMLLRLGGEGPTSKPFQDGKGSAKLSRAIAATELTPGPPRLLVHAHADGAGVPSRAAG